MTMVRRFAIGQNQSPRVIERKSFSERVGRSRRRQEPPAPLQLRRPRNRTPMWWTAFFARAVVTIRSARRVRAPQPVPVLERIPFLRQMLFSAARQPECAPQRWVRGRACAGESGSDCERETGRHSNEPPWSWTGPTTITVEMPNRPKPYSAKTGRPRIPPSDLAVLERSLRCRIFPILSLGGRFRPRSAVGDNLPGRRQFTPGDRRNP